MSITRYCTMLSIRWFEKARFGTVKFLIFLTAFNTASYIFILLGLSTAFERIFAIICFGFYELVAYQSTYIFSIDLWTDYFDTLRQAIIVNAIYTYDTIFGTSHFPYPPITHYNPISTLAVLTYTPLSVVKAAAFPEQFVRSQFFDPVDPVIAQVFNPVIAQATYTSFIDYTRFFIRLVFTIVFVGSWIFLRPLRWFTSLVLQRFVEAERGALAVFATALAGIVKIIQMLVVTS